jgi:hypothetical protein
MHNGPLGGAGGGQVETLTARLIPPTVREPLQLWNFGHVVDRVGGCGAAWSAAVRAGVSDGPIRAVAACGDHSAVAYAQHLDGTNIWTGLIFVLAAVLLGAFMVISGWAVLKVSVKAIWTTAILLPTLWLGSIPGAPQRRAVDVMWQFFRHGVEVMVYIVYVRVIGLAVERIVSNPLPAELGGTNPFAHVLMMGATSIAIGDLRREPAQIRHLAQHPHPGMRHDTVTVGGHFRPGNRCAALHLRSAFPPASWNRREVPLCLAGQALSHIYTPPPYAISREIRANPRSLGAPVSHQGRRSGAVSGHSGRAPRSAGQAAQRIWESDTR